MKKYQYSNAGGQIISVEQNALRFLWLWLARRDCFPAGFSIKAVISSLLYLLKIKPPVKSVSLPFNGTWCVKVRSGYKVFDVDKQVVTMVFCDEVDTSFIESEILQLKRISDYTFAPSLLKWNANDRWYQEELVIGKTSHDIAPDDPNKLIEFYIENIAVCVNELALTKEHQAVLLLNYIDRLSEEIYSSPVLEKDANSENIIAFTQEVFESLKDFGSKEILLVFSHGDFHLYNIFVTKEGTKLIDWEGNNTQSLLNDLYNYFFSQLWLRRNDATLINEMKTAISCLREHYIDHGDRNAADHLGQPELYRWVFYIERIHSMLTYFKASPKSINNWVKVYVEHERNMGDVRESRIEFKRQLI